MDWADGDKYRLEEQNAELLARLDQLLEQNMELSNQVANLTKMLFGSRSEKTRYSQEEIPQNQTSLFDEPSDFFGQPEKEEGEISRITVISTHTRKHRVPGWKEKQLENLPTEEYHHRLEEPVYLCCYGEMKELGTKEFLGNWQGLILCDGYSVYRQLPGIKFAHCWAHARRKWVEALELGGKASSPAVRLGKMVCDALFRMERDWQEMPIMARDQLRQKFARPLLEDFYRWLETQFAAPKSALDKAITYCLNQKAGLLKFLEVPALPIHNNGAENAIRPLTLGKKNWLFSTSEAGGKANAIYLSLVETCKANHIDFRQYLEKLLIELT